MATGRIEDKPVVEEDDEPEAVSFGRRALAWTAEYLPGLFRPVVLICALLLGAVGLAITLMGIIMTFAFFMLLEGGMVLIVGTLAYAQAVAWVLWGEMGFLPSLLTDFDEMRWTLWLVGLMTPGVGFIIYAKYFYVAG